MCLPDSKVFRSPCESRGFSNARVFEKETLIISSWGGGQASCRVVGSAAGSWALTSAKQWKKHSSRFLVPLQRQVFASKLKKHAIHENFRNSHWQNDSFVVYYQSAAILAQGVSCSLCGCSFPRMEALKQRQFFCDPWDAYR